MKILITGGAGFIGSHLAALLTERGDEVCVLDDLSAGSFSNIDGLVESGRFCFMKGSVLDEGLVDALISGSDAVFHLAAAVGVRKVLDDPDGAFAINTGGAEAVLSAAARRDKPVLFASSSEVYGPRPRNEAGRGPKARSEPRRGLREEDAAAMEELTGGRWTYAASKLFGETRGFQLARCEGLRFTAARLFNTIGPRQTGDYGMVVPRFVRQALDGRPLTVFGDGKQTRTFTWVGDTVECLVRLMDCPDAIGRVVNVGGREELSILELARGVRIMTGSDSPIEFVPYRKAYGRSKKRPFGRGRAFEDIRRRKPDTSLLESLIGTAPRTPVITALERTIEWARPRGRSISQRRLVSVG